MSIQTIESRAFGEEVDVKKLLVAIGASPSISQAKRLIQQGAVEIGGKRVGSTAYILDESILHCGKHFWCKLRLPPKKLTFERDNNQVKILNIE